MKLSLSSSSPSFALISVLALVSLAALTATAFLASARLERQATRSIGTQTQLDMALSSGMECAAQTINIFSEPSWNTAVTYWRGTNTADWTNEIGYLLLGKPQTSQSQPHRWVYYCGFSPAVFKNIDANAFLIQGTNFRQDSYLTDIGRFIGNMTNNFIANPPANNTNCTQIPLLGGRTSPPVGWVYIFQPKPIAGTTNTTNTPVARFAYFMEDLQGFIDAERMGGLPSRDSGTNPQEICLTNLLGNNATNFCQSNNRIKYVSPGMMIYAGGITSSNLAYVATRLLSWTNNPSYIPSGIPVSTTNSYSSAGTRKTNLNSLTDAAALATIISNNIPSFASTIRSGGVSSTEYLNSIAANIIDYVDTGSNPTTNGSSIGFDNYPLPVVFSDQIAWTRNVSNPSNSTIQVTTYIQFWNCSTLTSPAVTYTLQNNFQDTYLKSNGTASTIRLFSTNLSNSLSVPPLGPNQIIILTTTNTTNVGVNASFPGGLMISNVLGINNNSSTGYATYTNLFELKLGSTIISRHKGPYTRIGQKITNGSWDFEGTVLTMSRGKTTPAPIGDPRMLRFISNSIATPLEYRSSSSGNLKWGGYANFKDHPTGPAPWNGHPDNWPDGRMRRPASLTGKSQTGGAGGPIPVTVGTPITLPGNAPAILTTNGKFLTIFELGNVFDPIQWKPPAVFTSNSMYASCNINSTWTTNGAELYGGGTTLRIGRAEHQRFAFTNYTAGSIPMPNMGLSSAALLDIFCTTSNFDSGGQINLNTAPAPVLRALALGINLKSDPALVAGGTTNANYAVPDSMAEAFAQGVMRFRSKYPFLTPSHLSFIGTDTDWPNTNSWPTNAVFGNTNPITLTNIPGSLATSANIGVTEWSDQAAEEWFSKIYQLSTVQSFNFRVYVVAQLVDTNLMPKGAMARKYYQFYLRNNSTTNVSAGPLMHYQSPY